ncbi:shikimate dehydrogenase family protein [Roseinatronobacter sp. NSM]|uniref:shikimate dehydrogenase family protein n=1 Tax=Roseinatronobacter sp. NSM TaxID=3457785 RepID=UPI0040355E64
MTPDLLLGLIGDNIAASRSPLLHVLAGRQNALRVQYDRLVPALLGKDFASVFADAAAGGYRGVNVTYPYKEQVVARVTVPDPLVRAVGAVNTVIFEPDGPVGHNTDYSGFMAAYRGLRGDAPVGAVLMIGTGGVGRAVAFGLVALGVRDLRLVDRDRSKADALAADLRQAAPGVVVQVADDAQQGAAGAQGVVNCTPVGMVGHDGTPLARSAMAGAEWAFDAVYTPADTQFLTDAQAQGAQVLSGWELFFWQGVHAWALFSGGRALDLPQLRADLLAPAEGVA